MISKSTKASKLQEIAREIEKCKICKAGKSGKAVPGEGNPEADIVFIGEAPGKTEARTGRPSIKNMEKQLKGMERSILLLFIPQLPYVSRHSVNSLKKTSKRLKR